MAAAGRLGSGTGRGPVGGGHLPAAGAEMGSFAAAYFRGDAIPPRTAPPRRPPSAHLGEVVRAILTALGVAAVVVALALLLASLVQLAPALVRSSQMRPAGPAPVDLPVERVISALPDGREARGSFVVRLRQDAPSSLITAAGYTPTPDLMRRGARTSVPAEPNAGEALVRQSIGGAMAQLRYDDVAGEAGKRRRRETVRDAVNADLPGAPVTDVFIREYVVK